MRAPCVIISNHSTFNDQFIVGIGFNLPINFVASDSLFRNGILSKIMKVVARPIPIAKGASDPSAVKSMISIVKAGGTVALFPEGNRTFFGDTGSVNPAIAKLIKKMRVPLVIVNIKGGFNTAPRWRKSVSKGRMDAYVRRVIERDELESLTDEQVYQIILDDLYFNEFEYNAEKKIIFKGKRKAEHLESVLFYCPSCKGLDTLKSDKNDFFCTSCGAKARINGIGFFEGVENSDSLPSSILEWSHLQEDAVKNFVLPSDKNASLFSDKVELYKYERAKSNELLGEGNIKLYCDSLEVCGKKFDIIDISDMALQSVEKLQIYLNNGEKYLVKIKNIGTNLLKYMIFYYKIKAIIENKEDFHFGY